METTKNEYIAPICRMIEMEPMQVICGSPETGTGTSTTEDLEGEDNYEWDETNE